ncbi:MAG: class I SAM-dependent methyltransferase [Gemmatimonadota bacterium]
MPSPTELLEQWQADLAAWAIPDRITAAVPDSPWVLPREVFARRADRLRQAPGGPSYDREWEALGAGGGSVLDVGSGAGAACLPLAARTTRLTAVDTDERMLGMLTERAAAAGIDTAAAVGRWPDIAGQVPAADLVTCHNVVFNVPDLGPFLAQLTSHARRRVVVETTAVHPLAALNALWLRFHGLKRPEGPSASDLLRILDAMGIRARHTEWCRPAEADYRGMAELVEVTRRRLCLPPERAGEVEAALRDLRADSPASPGHLGDLGTAGRDVVTIWWEGSA